MDDNQWNLDPETREDLRSLMRTLKQYAIYILEESPAFVPLGGSVNLNGEVGIAMAERAQWADRPAAIDALVRGFRRLAEGPQIRAAGDAVVETASSQEHGAGELLALRLECRSGVSVRIEVPFTRVDKAVAFQPSLIMRQPTWLFDAEAPIPAP